MRAGRECRLSHSASVRAPSYRLSENFASARTLNLTTALACS